jgi:large-conductance mechanosensitive channel
MNALNIIIVLSFTSVVFLFWNILISEKISKYLQNKGFNTYSYVSNLLTLRNLFQYKKLTQNNDGKAGEYYHLFIITAIIFVIIVLTIFYLTISINPS